MNYFKILFYAVFAAFFVSSCADSSDQLVIYSGRSQALVDELVENFEEETGIDVEVRYGNDAELLAVLNEEGDRSSADLFWANTTGALANANNEDLLAELPDSLVQKPDAYQSSSGKWIPVTARFRVLAYNPENVDEEDLPESVMDLPDMEEFEGRVGWTPTYSSFYDFMTAMRLEEGEDATMEWLEGMQGLDPNSYSSNTPMVQAIAAGEIDMGLTNHYYIMRLKDEGSGGDTDSDSDTQADTDSDSDTQADTDTDTSSGGEELGPDSPIETHYFTSGDIGNLALVTGAALLNTSDRTDEARQFLDFLLSEKAQQFAAETVYEYPVIRGIDLPDMMLDEEEAFELSPEYDYEQLRQLDATLDLLREAGLN